MKNVAFQGKHKLADKWGKHPYIVVSQPNPDIPVFRVRPESGVGRVKTLHRNLLLPCNFLPQEERPTPSGPTNKKPTRQPQTQVPPVEVVDEGNVQDEGTDDVGVSLWANPPTIMVDEATPMGPTEPVDLVEESENDVPVVPDNDPVNVQERDDVDVNVEPTEGENDPISPNHEANVPNPQLITEEDRQVRRSQRSSRPPDRLVYNCQTLDPTPQVENYPPAYQSLSNSLFGFGNRLWNTFVGVNTPQPPEIVTV